MPLIPEAGRSSQGEWEQTGVLWLCDGVLKDEPSKTRGGDYLVVVDSAGSDMESVALVYGDGNAALIVNAPKMWGLVKRAVASLSTSGRNNSEERLAELAALARELYCDINPHIGDA